MTRTFEPSQTESRSGAYACGLPLVGLQGTLRRTDADWLAAEFRSLSREPVVVVSLLDCRYADLAVLATLTREFYSRSGLLVVVLPPAGAVRDAFDLSGLACAFGAFDTLEDAHRQGAASLKSFAVLAEVERSSGRAVDVASRTCTCDAARPRMRAKASPAI